MKRADTLSALVLALVIATTAHFPSIAQTASGKADTPIAASAPTAVPALVPYSGAAIGSDGKSVGAERAITFLIYKEETGGEPLWTETQTVTIDLLGHYKVQLGATSPNGLPADLFATGEARWLEVQITGQAPQPRGLLSSVPYALKASDAATLGGLPASAYALAGTRSAGIATSVGSQNTGPDTNSTVSTTGGTTGFVSMFTGATTIADSILFQNANGIGINTTDPNAALDIHGREIVRGPLYMARKGNASPSTAFNSNPFALFAQAYSTTIKGPVEPSFQWQAEPIGNNTASPDVTLNLLSSNGIAGPEQTGFYFNSNGTINFASGQTFPGTGAGTITAVTAGTGLTGGGTSGAVTLNLNTALVPLLSGTNKFTGNQTITGTLTSSSSGGYAIEGVDSSSSGSGIFGVATSTSGYSSGVFGTSASTTGSGVAGTATSTSGLTNGVYGTTASSSGTGVGGAATSATGYTNGIYGTSASPNGTGVSGNASSGTGNGVGASGTSASFNGTGVMGSATSTSGSATGVFGTTASPNGLGVQGVNYAAVGGTGMVGVANAASGYSNGVYGKSVSVNGTGVSGQATSGTGNTVGTSGTSASPNGVGVQGVNTAATGGTGVNGVSNATSGYGNGVYGSSASPTGNGVHGDVTAPYGQGVYGSNEATSGPANGVLGVSSSPLGIGVSGSATTTSGSATGVYGQSSSPMGTAINGSNLATTGYALGVSGTSASSSGVGVQGQVAAPQGKAVVGINSAATGPAIGVIGVSASSADGATGVNGSATGTHGNATGVLGSSLSSQGYGVFGFSPNIAVAAVSKTCTSSGCTIKPGTAGQFVTGAGGVVLQGVREAADFSTTQVFYVDASGNGYFAGDLNVTGKVVKGSGSFKIDDPLDPANKYLSHSFVESPDMMNVYNGNVTTDKLGRATVELPEYFEALNRDFRYQLTVMGQFAQAIVATKIGKNRFVIRTNKPSVEVSWQVTGIRKDAYANANRIPTEEEKPADERGYYLHPELFAQPESKGIVAAHQSEVPSKSVAQLKSAGNR